MVAHNEDSNGPRGAISIVPRKEFLIERWQYKPGNHVTFLGPTQSGKTTLAFQLLKVTTHKDLPGVIVVIKPRDPVVTDATEKLQYKLVEDWPPLPHQRKFQKPAGWTVWPRHKFSNDPREDDEHLSDVFGRTLMGSYKRGNCCIFADEVFGLSKELNLDRHLNAIWSRGASMGAGLWASSQRPYNIPQLAYGSAEHLFIANDPDKRSRDRYGEIGGVDPDLLKELTPKLQKYQWIYIRRTGPELCIVDA